MRILTICAYTWEAGGPPKVIFDHAKAALQAGHQVDILSPISPNEIPYTVPEGARLILCPRTPLVSRFFREVSVKLYQYLKQHIREYDLVHCHGLWHFGVLAPFMLDRQVAKVVTVHGVLDPWAYGLNRWKKDLIDTLAQRAYLRRADLIQVLSDDEKSDVQRYLGKPHPNVVVIPNGVRVGDFAHLPPKGTFRSQHGIPADRKMVLFMSRLNVKKGLDLLLPAFRDYVREHADAVLVLAGSDDGYEATARQFIEQHNLGDSVRLVGLLTGRDKKAALADADLFTLPSYSEGFSMAVLEAMASGVPTLVSDRVGFGPTIRTHEAAGLVELTPDSIRSGFERMLGDVARRERIRENATALVQAQYDLDLVTQHLLNEYEKLVKPQPVR